MNRIRALVAVAGCFVVVTGCAGSDPDNNATSDGARPTTATRTVPATSPTPSASPTLSATSEPTASPTPKVVTYETDDKAGVTVTEPGQKSQIADASESFSTFLDRQLERAINNRDRVCPEPPQVYVNKVAPEGWASGGYFVPQCGGYAALWAVSKGSWREVWTGQELVDCQTLERYKFPAAIAGTACMDGDESVQYPRAG